MAEKGKTWARRPGEARPLGLELHPLTPDRWDDLVDLFGKRGACGGCWDMWWRIPAKQWKAQKGDGNRRAFRRIVKAGPAPGILAYADGKAVGWCAVAPREDFPRLEGSEVLARVDDQPVWSVGCLFVARTYRKRGVSVALLRAAVEYAASRGARIVEGYPKTAVKKEPDVFVWTGVEAAFEQVGFKEAARRSPTKPVMRFQLEEKAARGRTRKGRRSP
jgi:GNAT superfamily N-acetyltransferase